jgi:hypothetical protein
MADHEDTRPVPARDVPPPRPVTAVGPGAAPAEDETGLGRAARAIADAVTGLLGSAGPGDGAAANGTSGRSAAGILRDVVGAVASAAGSRREPGVPGGPSSPGATAPAGARDRGPTAVLGDLLAAAGPRLPIRDAERLRQAYPGATREEIADTLVARAGRLTAGIGAATGGLSAAQWFAPPSLLALPLELGAETVLTAAVEVVMVGELHELYGRPAEGDARGRAAAYLASWSNQRAVDGTAAGLAGVLGSAGLRALRRRVGRRMARALPAAAPFLLGAAIAGRGNRKATETLADRVRGDLRRHLGPGSAR